MICVSLLLQVLCEKIGESFHHSAVGAFAGGWGLSKRPPITCLPQAPLGAKREEVAPMLAEMGGAPQGLSRAWGIGGVCCCLLTSRAWMASA